MTEHRHRFITIKKTGRFEKMLKCECSKELTVTGAAIDESDEDITEEYYYIKRIREKRGKEQEIV